MKKIINKPDDFVTETIEGILLAHPAWARSVSDNLQSLVIADAPINGKVAIATGGGSGHLPVFLGYVGKGLCDGVAIGNVFSSPSAGQMLAVTNAINGGAGVLYIYGNYQGDTLNFDMAADMARMEDIEVETVLVTDDVASAPKDKIKSRRGVAGLFFVYKIAGAKAEEGADLLTVKAAAEKAAANVRSMGVALSPCTVPEAGKPTFSIGEDEMEIGMGIHGERGLKRIPLQTADEITSFLVEQIVADYPLTKGDKVAVLVNGLGATPKEELYIIYRHVHKLLSNAGISVHKAFIGEFATSMEMAGASLSLLKLDDELTKLLEAPAYSPFLQLV